MKGNEWLIPFLIGMLVGGFLTGYFFILRFRTICHKGIIATLNGLDKLLAPKKKPEASGNGAKKRTTQGRQE